MVWPLWKPAWPCLKIQHTLGTQSNSSMHGYFPEKTKTSSTQGLDTSVYSSFICNRQKSEVPQMSFSGPPLDEQCIATIKRDALYGRISGTSCLGKDSGNISSDFIRTTLQKRQDCGYKAKVWSRALKPGVGGQGTSSILMGRSYSHSDGQLT